MILTCPECSTRYNANDAAFQPAGRRVRCAKCGHAWHQDPPVIDDDIGIVDADPEPEVSSPEPFAAPQPSPTEDAPTPEPEPEAVAHRAGRFERLGVVGGWAGLVIVILVIGWGAVSYRQQIARLWPQSASLYKVLGLPVNARGLAFTDVNYKRETEDKQTVLAVSGKLVNISGHERAVPQIRVILTGDRGHELYHWDFTPEVSVLKAGQSASFLTRLSRPPDGARHLTLEFAGGKG
jgi:predicted Zn finger-like uncharacterized protein